MPTNSPLTSTPMPVLADAPNIESATHPGFTNLEKYAIPRFTTVGARNSAFATVTPQAGQLVYISGLGANGFQVYNGSAWVEFGGFINLRDITVRTTGTAERNSTTFADVTELSVPVVEGVYRIEASIIYGTANNFATDCGINFIFPGSTSRLSVGVIGRGVSDSGANHDGNRMNLNNNHARVTGDAPFVLGGNSGGEGGLGNSTFALFVGHLAISGANPAGDFRVQFASSGTPGIVRIFSGSMLQARKFI